MGDLADELYDEYIKHLADEDMNTEKYVTVTCEFKAATAKAVLISQDENEMWIPRSLLAWSTDKEMKYWEKGTEQEVKMFAWKAEQEGLNYNV